MTLAELQEALRAYEDAKAAMLDGRPTKAKAEALRVAHAEFATALAELHADAVTHTVIDASDVVIE